MDKSLKQTFLQDIIPTVEEMIKKEKDHLRFLKMTSLFPFYKPDKYIRQSEQRLAHYEQRLKEYKEYADKLDD